MRQKADAAVVDDVAGCHIIGHKSVSFTLNVYGRANLQQKARCMNLLNELL